MRAKGRGINIAVSDVPEGFKRCSKCKEVKERADFHRASKESSGLQALCKECAVENTRLWRGANRDRARAWGREWYAKNSHKELKRRRRWRAKNPQKVLAANTRWKRANPSKVYEMALRRFYRIQNAPGGEFSLDRPEYRARCAEFGYRCYYCKAGPLQALDHVIPVSRGGSNAPDNIVPACRRCNSQKGAKLPEEWIHRWYLEEES